MDSAAIIEAMADHGPAEIEETMRTSPAMPADETGVIARIRSVHRALAELRRGTPVVLQGSAPLVLLAAETAGARGLAELAALAGGKLCLLLARPRAAALLGRPVEVPIKAFALSPALLDPAFLKSLADPTAEQMLPEEPVLAPVPALAEAAIRLAKLSRLLPAVLAAPLAEGADLAELLSVSDTDLASYAESMATGLVRVAEASVPLEHAPDARIVAFRAPDAGIEHLAIVVGQPDYAGAPLVRLHSECFTGDLLGSLRCDCGPQLRGAIWRMAEAGGGILLYLAQEGRGIGLVNKLRAYALQDRGLDTIDANKALGWEADERNFLLAATMLGELGVSRVRLLTNNPRKVASLSACGVEVVGREQHSIAPNGVNDRYLATKAERFGHLLG